MDVMGVPGGQRSARVVPEGQGERQGCPRGSTRTLGVPGWVRGGVKDSQGVKRGVPGVEGSLGDPRGLRGVSEVYEGLKEAPGIIKESFSVKYIFFISRETNGGIMIAKIVLKSDL